MKSIKNALLALVLATCAAAASAVPTYVGFDFVFPDMTEEGLQQTWTFGLGDATVQAGETFSWDFLFNTPPSNPTTWFGFLLKPDTAGAVSFSGVGFFTMGEDQFSVPGFNLGGSSSALFGSGWLDSGVYDLFVTGTFLVDGGGFSGLALDDVVDPNAVPEPMTLGLVGLGLAGLVGARRRRATSEQVSHTA